MIDNMSAGKGDKYRPVDWEKYSKNWDATFGEKPKEKKMAQTTHEIEGEIDSRIGFIAVVSVSWEQEDQGIGWYAHGDGHYNDIDMRWELQDYFVEEISLFNEDGESIVDNLVNRHNITEAERDLIQSVHDSIDSEEFEPDDLDGYDGYND